MQEESEMKKDINGLKVGVEYGDIDYGVKDDTDSCPVAIALKRATGRKNVAVFSRQYFQIGRKWYIMPKSVKSFISKFDKGLACQPFNFVLNESENQNIKAVNDGENQMHFEE